MSIQYRFFSIPLKYESESELNHFLKTVRMTAIHRELVCQQGQYYWAIAVEYITGDGKGGQEGGGTAVKKKIDYKEVLSPEDFSIFARLRDWRKETAGKEAVQLYTVFTNDQLAAMVEKKITAKAGLKEIDGVGDARVEKYGDAVIAILKEEIDRLEKKDETGKPSVPPDSGTGKSEKGILEGGQRKIA